MLIRKFEVIIFIITITCLSFIGIGAYVIPGYASLENNDEPFVCVQKGSENNPFTYVQRSYYSNHYIIEIGWNLNDKESQEYYKRKEFTLKDNSKIAVYFDENISENLEDENVKGAISDLIYSLNNTNTQDYPIINAPLVSKVIYVGADDISKTIEKYYQDESLSSFSAIFAALDSETKNKYCERIYNDNKIAFFSSIIPYMDEDLIKLYAEKADQDKKVAFFSVILGHMQCEDINSYTEKYYKDNNIARFTVLIPHMTKEVREKWIAKAQNDNKNTFLAVLSEY